MRTARQEHRTPESPKGKAGYLVGPAVFGFLNGYAILHPAAMVIFRMLEGPHGQHGGEDLLQSIWRPFAHSFQLSMLPMGLAFGGVGAVVGLVYGYQNRTIRRQRDDLRGQLARNEGLVQELECKADQLRKQNERLLELERIKRRTTHFLVHDFKTQLNCIEGFAGLTLEDEEGITGRAGREGLCRIRRQARGMLGSVNNLLDIARLEEAPAMRTEPVNPSDLLAGVFNDVALAGRGKRVTVDPESHGRPPVDAEPVLLRRVLLNLVSNSLKHNRPGTRVCLGAGLTPEGREVVFSCRDDGEGIAPESLPTLFEPFHTGDRAQEESTGLGLAFARSAVEAHGGRIWCDSSPGHGTCFYFTLPTERSTVMTDQQQAPRRVLVVEDEADFAALMASMLRGLGYNVSIAFDGIEALSQVQTDAPDAITLDIQMPRKSGALFYRQLKSQEALRDIPVIVVTGLIRDDPDWNAMIRAFLDVEHLPQPDAYLDKPVDRDALAGLLSDVFAERRAV